jgi:hypothetical protein
MGFCSRDKKINFVPDRGTAVFQPILRAANAAFAG